MKMNEFNYMSAALELFAATVTAVMLIGCFLERKHKTKSGKLLVWCLISQTAMLLVDVTILVLSGRLDTVTAPQLEAELEKILSDSDVVNIDTVRAST